MTQPTNLKEGIRLQLQRDMDKYLSKGGTITSCPPCTMSNSTGDPLIDNIFNKGKHGKSKSR